MTETITTNIINGLVSTLVCTLLVGCIAVFGKFIWALLREDW